MKRTSCILFLGLCVTMALARDESSTNGSGPRSEAAPFASPQPDPGPRCGISHAVKGDNELFAAFVFPVPPESSCADSIANCKDPVKYLGTDAGCACFACEYGKATQHNVCTNVKADRDALLRRAVH
jgi:hypothetical protein